MKTVLVMTAVWVLFLLPVFFLENFVLGRMVDREKTFYTGRKPVFGREAERRPGAGKGGMTCG